MLVLNQIYSLHSRFFNEHNSRFAMLLLSNPSKDPEFKFPLRLTFQVCKFQVNLKYFYWKMKSLESWRRYREKISVRIWPLCNDKNRAQHQTIMEQGEAYFRVLNPWHFSPFFSLCFVSPNAELLLESFPQLWNFRFISPSPYIYTMRVRETSCSESSLCSKCWRVDEHETTNDRNESDENQMNPVREKTKFSCFLLHVSSSLLSRVEK